MTTIRKLARKWRKSRDEDEFSLPTLDDNRPMDTQGLSLHLHFTLLWLMRKCGKWKYWISYFLIMEFKVYFLVLSAAIQVGGFSSTLVVVKLNNYLNLRAAYSNFVNSELTEQEELVRSFERSQAQQSFVWRVYFYSKLFTQLSRNTNLIYFNLTECVCSTSLFFRCVSCLLHLSASFITVGTGMNQSLVLIVLFLCIWFQYWWCVFLSVYGSAKNRCEIIGWNRQKRGFCPGETLDRCFSSWRSNSLCSL